MPSSSSRGMQGTCRALDARRHHPFLNQAMHTSLKSSLAVSLIPSPSLCTACRSRQLFESITATSPHRQRTRARPVGRMETTRSQPTSHRYMLPYGSGCMLACCTTPHTPEKPPASTASTAERQPCTSEPRKEESPGVARPQCSECWKAL